MLGGLQPHLYLPMSLQVGASGLIFVYALEGCLGFLGLVRFYSGFFLRFLGFLGFRVKVVLDL